MGEFDAVARWVDKVEHALDGSARKRALTAAGNAGKKSALEAATQSLGADRRMRNMRTKAVLSVGYDSVGDSSVELKFRGPWRLAEEGRKASGQIRPRRRGGRRAVLTPLGPRARSSYKRSRGLHTYSNATRKASVSVPKAYHDQMLDEIRRVL